MLLYDIENTLILWHRSEIERYFDEMIIMGVASRRKFLKRATSSSAGVKEILNIALLREDGIIREKAEILFRKDHNYGIEPALHV